MKIINTIKEWLVWIFSREVLEAINNGASYSDVQKLVEGKVYNARKEMSNM